MQIPKDMIVSMIENRMGGAQAQQAAQQLPDQVDHEQHAGVLSQFGINPQEIISQFGGGQGQANQPPSGGYQEQARQQGGDYQQQGGDYQQEGGGYQEQGGDYQQQGGDYQQEGGDYQQQGGDYQQEGGGYQEQGGDYQQQGGGYQEQGGDYQQEGGG